MNFNPADCDKLRSLLEEAVKSIEEKMGVSIEVGRMSYRDNITVKLTASKLGESGHAETKEWNDWGQYAKWDEHLEVEWLGKTFHDNSGNEHTIIGYRSRAPKRPVLTQRADGKQNIWPSNSVAHHMKSQHA